MKDLPDPTPEGAGQTEDAAAGVGAARGSLQEAGRQAGSERLLDLAEGGAGERVGGLPETGASRGQARAPSREEGCLHVQYIYWTIFDRQAKITTMKHTSLPATPGLSRQYEQLRQRLSQVGYLSQGSVQDRTGRVGGGAGYQWTRKVAQKTVTVALTQEQFELLQQATHNYQLLRRLLHQMETLSRKIIFHNCPHPARRKRLNQKVLGTN